MAVEDVLIDEQLLATQYRIGDAAAIATADQSQISTTAVTQINDGTGITWTDLGSGAWQGNLTFTPGGLASLNPATNPADTAPNQTAAYVQADVQAILTELRAVKSALLAAGITV